MFQLVPNDPEEVEVPDWYDPDEQEPCDECGGKVRATGGRGYYNGHYDCYTLYLECENCGPYEVECV